jgi:hypothetical protein
MSESLQARIKRMRESVAGTQRQIIEQQIRQGIPAIFAAAGYPEGTYKIQSLQAVQVADDSQFSDGTYMELQVLLTGDDRKMDNLKTGLKMFMAPNAGVRREGNTIIFRKKLD